MDNIITGQQALEIKLDLVNQQVQSNKGEIEQLKKTADFVSEQLTKATCVTKENAKKTADIDKDVDFLMNKMQSLEAEVNATERYSRNYNARFLGVPEETGERGRSLFGSSRAKHVFRAARAGLRQDGIRIVDDLTCVDWQEKRRVQPLMNTQTKQK